MAKRIVTRIGNVFCVEIDGKYKYFFQYIANDLDQLNSSVIRVFKKKYLIEDNPKIEEILNGEVGFYAHTILRDGIADGVWYKAGTSKVLGLEGLTDFYWGTLTEILFVYGDKYIDIDGVKIASPELKIVDPTTNWTLWNVRNPRYRIGILPKEFIDWVEVGSVFPYEVIVSRIKYGYYICSSDAYSVLKRKPWDDVDSYVKIEEEDEMRYFHFLGQEPMREMVVSRSGIVRLSREHPESQGETLRRAEFWETNWESKNFIVAEEFEKLWQREL